MLAWKTLSVQISQSQGIPTLAIETRQEVSDWQPQQQQQLSSVVPKARYWVYKYADSCNPKVKIFEFTSYYFLLFSPRLLIASPLIIAIFSLVVLHGENVFVKMENGEKSFFTTDFSFPLLSLSVHEKCVTSYNSVCPQLASKSWWL